MKVKNRAIAVLLLFIFIFSITGSASAAKFSDVTGTGDEASAIYRLSGLGVLDGYPDGTFRAEDTITRAEFAKIACVVAGLKTVASGMSGVASSFNDVATDHWANGWINVAAAQGYVKGDPDGSFRPDDEITQSEVITVLLRLLGYNDNLPGEWPSDYIAKAANLGILDDITFSSNAAAARGLVAVVTSAVLDENVVEYKASDNLFEEAEKTYDKNDGNGKMSQSYTLLYDKFNESESTENALIINFTVSDSDEITIDYYTWDDDFTTLSSLKTKKVAEDCTYSGGGNILDVNEHFADFVVNDDNEITSITVKDYTKFGPDLSDGTIMDELEIENGKVVIDGKKYNWVDTKIVVENFEGASGLLTANPSTLSDQIYDDSDCYAVILNEDDDVCAIRAWTYPTAGVVDYVKNDRIFFMDNAAPVKNTVAAGIASNAGTWDGFVNTGNFADEDIFVEKDGEPASLDDLEAMDTVNILKDYRGCDYYIIASSAVVDGTLQTAKYVDIDEDGSGSIEADEQFVKQIKVDGQWYTLALNDVSGSGVYTGYYSIDDGDTFEGKMTKETLSDEYDMWNEELKVLLTASGRVSSLIFGGASSASKMYGVITEISGEMSYKDGTTVRSVKLMQADGSEYTYPISEDTYIKKTGAAGAFNKKIDNLTAADSYQGVKYSLDDVDSMIQAFVDGDTSGDGTVDAADGEKVAGLVAVTLKSSGIVDRIEVFSPVSTVLSSTNLDEDNELLKLGSTWMDAGEVVVFNLNDGASGSADSTGDLEETNVVGWSELEKTMGTVIAYYANSKNECKYVLINSAPMASDSHYAIYYDEYSDSDDWVEFVGHDAYKIDSIVNGLTKGDVVKYKFSGNEIIISSIAVYYGDTSSIAVENVSGHVLSLDNGESYKTNDDTQYLDITDDKNLEVLDGVAEGDTVIVIPDDTDSSLAAAVVVVDYSGIGAGLTAAKAAAAALTSSSYVDFSAVTTALAMAEASDTQKKAKTTAINNAIAALVLKSDLTAYNAALAAVNQADYTVASWAAYKLVVDANVVTVANTQAEVNTATSNITTAQGSLVLKADLTAYNTALAAVNQADYTVASWAAYKLVVDANVVTTENTQAEVNTATSNITTAQGSLVLKADLTAYNAALTAVNQADYTVASWAAYKLVVDANVVTTENTQAEVNTATSNITVAQVSLVAI